ncbi:MULTISPECIES: helix-turn-helix domain-containing protein [Caballeronia]|uniref:helix-turn-helix domain-containing protein n=1 Tax=Caballeronia TaxID=1827195 RepID=UPI0005A02329|nr:MULTISPECIES: helix-turn-helix transcriptional regulator [unclassified Caballeronia]AQH00083.1 transcriptional regulator [Burkholderia sp. KK1]MCE4543077.1 helix-turn-helix domain-containing protein [Caballeronia sp. PC1]MCE4567868.1 helix-turn-helix domain-containing protein [Caballeronia sp. CLC5]
MQRELARRYNPVPHTEEDDRRMLADPEFKAAYDALGPKYEALDALLRARKEAGLTQAQIAERMGTTASAVARLEGSLISEKHSPSVATLRKYATACGKTLRIAFV